MNKYEIITQVMNKIDLKQIIDLAKDLIRIPSDTGQEKAVADWVFQYFTNRGIPVKTIQTVEDRPNVIASVGSNKTPHIVLNGHLDTVPIANPTAWGRNPYDPVIQGNRLIGRGSCDMKGACAVIAYVITLLQELSQNVELKGAVSAQLVVDEEKGGDFGTQYLISQMKSGKLPRPDYVLIGEKSRNKIRNAERGVFQFQITFMGRASHTCDARWKGINAIEKAAKAILVLQRDFKKFHPSVGFPVISVNQITGGIANNQVPAECTITVDRRTVPGESKEQVLEAINQLLNEITVNDADFVYEIRPLVSEDGKEIYDPANITEPDSELVTTIQEVLRKFIGLEPEFFVDWAGATDGRFYRYEGIQTVGFGPDGEGVHGANEYVTIETLEIQAKVYLGTILSLCL
ncbi:MAG: M20 family metallopeptidase [Candidatus Heimdallarchaeota archaeon]